VVSQIIDKPNTLNLFLLLSIVCISLQVVVLRVVELTHQPVDVRGSVATDVRDEQSDEFRRNVVEHGAVHVDLG
jgi:cell division protein FtsL